MPSYTNLALTEKPPVMPNFTALANPSTAEKWVRSLPSVVQNNLEKRLTAIIQRMPDALQLEFRRRMIETAGMNPVPLTVDGLSSDGLGWYAAAGAVVGALFQTGGAIYTAREQKDLTKDLQSNALAHDSVLQQAALQAQKETQLALIQAQTEAAQIAGGASVARAQINAPVLASAMKWGGITLGAVALLVGGYIVIKKKK